jgi:hypothetical protein
MFYVILILLGLGIILHARLLGPVPLPTGQPVSGFTADLIGAVLMVIGIGSTSVLVVGANEVGHLQRVYLGASMPQGRIIALPGENGPQAEVLPPGFHFRPFVNVLYEVEMLPITEIAPGEYGLVTARDGKPLAGDAFLARGWPEATFEQMLDAEYFLTEGGGERGPQLSVLKPGKYRLNRYLFDVRTGHALDVPAGSVAVIKSNVNEHDGCDGSSFASDDPRHEGLAVPLVPRGCVGVWDTPLLPNRYYLNSMAYTPTLIPTQVQTWNYKGGYTTRQIHVTVSSDGQITQDEDTPVVVPVPEDAADGAVVLTIEGWRVPLELRALVQVEPGNAPRVVASVGDVRAVEDKIISPAIRSVVRNETALAPDSTQGIQGVRVMDLLTRRGELERAVEKAIIPEGLKAGVTIKEIRFGDPIIPPELLIATQRKQLAEQLRVTYAEEKRAQSERIQTEKARATADQQGELVRAEIAVQVAEQGKLRLQKEGEGERLRLTEIAAGQQAQTAVLGEERVLQLAMLKELLAAARDNPEIVKVPQVLVQDGGASGLAGAAAVLGASNLLEALKKPPVVPAVPGGTP